jgi:hypothetical protein
MSRSLVFAAVFLGLAHTASAKSVYLNNVNIDGVVGQKFENCTVEIDAKGNVFITAKGYRVEVAPQQPAPSAPRPANKRYWLVTEKPARGMDEWEIEVFINNQFIRKVGPKDEQIYLEVTKYFVGGTNQVMMVAKKKIEGERKSASPQHYSRVIIGEGEMAKDTIVIEKQLLDYRRNASEMGNYADTFPIELK